MAGERATAPVGGRLPVERDGPALRGDLPGNDLQKGAFAGAVWADEAIDTASLKCQIDTVKYRPVAYRVIDPGKVQEGRGHEETPALLQGFGRTMSSRSCSFLKN
ncbi:hypothetical protein FHX06_002894 [Rhizobium sp. BK512]|nr:hypothetical protein [Rhizobium sp. BK512]